VAFTVEADATPAHAACCAAFGVPHGDGPKVCVAYQPGGISTSHWSSEVAKYAVPSGAAKHHVDVSLPVPRKHPQTGSVMGAPARHPPVALNSVPVKVTGGCDASPGGVQTKVEASGLASEEVTVPSTTWPLHAESPRSTYAETTSRVSTTRA
jgi:hypothetical protein